MVDKLNRERMAANYGFALSFMKSDKELWNLFNKAVKNTWQPDMFIAQLRDTKWFKTHSASVRNAILQQKSDPATYKANVDQMYSTVRDTWGNMFGKKMMDKRDMRNWAETAHRMGWSESQLIDRMANSINYRKALRRRTLGGEAADMQVNLAQLEEAYGIKLGRKFRARHIERVMKGDDTLEGLRKKYMDMAIRQYGNFADEIRGGATVEDVAAPYKAKMAELLEMNPEEVSLENRHIQKALRNPGDDKPRGMSLTDFERQVKKDKRWQYTDNAREEVSTMATSLLRSFGLQA